jgi:AbrB family looped-hinge helix DNA binding protein
MISETMKIGKKGVFVLPASLRKRFGLKDGSMVVAEENEYGILLRPAMVLPTELYTPERVAEFLLSNAADEKEYDAAQTEVKSMGIDPDSIDHFKKNPPHAPSVS